MKLQLNTLLLSKSERCTELKSVVDLLKVEFDTISSKNKSLEKLSAEQHGVNSCSTHEINISFKHSITQNLFKIIEGHEFTVDIQIFNVPF